MIGIGEFLRELHVRELLKLCADEASKKATSKKYVSLCSLYDILEIQLRSLENLGVSLDKYACTLYPVVEAVLTEPVLREWERQRSRFSAFDKDDYQLDGILQSLRKEVECEKRLALAKRYLSKQ